MDKNAIKKYAVWARREMISRVSQRAAYYEITDKGWGDASSDSVLGRVLSAEEKRQRQALIRKVQEKGYEQVMEEAAYTWFNRFAALRFMEVNGYLPSHVRVFTNDAGEFKPQILAEAIHLDLDGLDMNKVYALESANKTEELFKYLLIVQCNALNSILPGLFQRIEDYTELLLPDNLLREGSVIEQMVTSIPEEDWTDQVQIIGWLYQYYNTELKDKVFADLKKNIKVSRENIPAATQLYTPDWIVHYMVENSLGRLWLEEHPNDALKSEWKYYLDEAEQEPDVQAQLAAIRKEYAALKPEEIKVIDPCMGSGHILCVFFDVLIRIYEDYGYTAREAAVKIVENNLYGLDIDERAAQLAFFAVMMKARQYDRRFFSRKVQPHVYATTGFSEGEEYGSLLITEDTGEMLGKDGQMSFYDNEWQVRKLLAQKYDVVVTNPPYMGASNMNAKLNDFIKNRYADYKSDYFSAFIVRATELAKPNGYCGFFTPYVWMFIQSYEKLRKLLCQQKTIETLIQFEYSAFEEATVPVCTFVFKNNHISKKGCYFRLTDFRGGMEVQRQKTIRAIEDHNCGYYYEANTDNFSKIPGSPVAYWINADNIFKFDCLAEHLQSGGRTKTHDNNLYVRNWWEVEKGNNRWVPYANGGEYRKWYGDHFDVVDWSKNARTFYDVHGGLCKEKYWFKEGITWGAITSCDNSYRIKPKQFMFSSASPVIFTKDFRCDFSVLGYLNSKVAKLISNIINPTLNQNVNDTLRLPYCGPNEKTIGNVTACIDISKCDWDSFETSWDFQCHPLVRLSRKTTYKANGIPSYRIEDAFFWWENECETRFQTLKANEEELNRIFIDIYGLQDELTPEVEDKDVTVRRADLGRDIRSLISYAVGCMFGRYSLDKPGLVYAGGDWETYYRIDKGHLVDEHGSAIVIGGLRLSTAKPPQINIDGEWKTTVYPPDFDNIIPICDDEYFNDDITGKFIKWVEVVYGKDTLEENLKFIADALGGKGSSREVIRNYFLNDFYADHLKIYQKRPIYWLFDSGKKNGFKALIYMHRYRPDTIARIRTDYVHEQQSRYRTAIADLEQRINGASTSERVKLNKQLQMLQAQAEEIRVYEEKIHHLADQMIEIDLDDGVKHNYTLFQDVLAKIK